MSAWNECLVNDRLVLTDTANKLSRWHLKLLNMLSVIKLIWIHANLVNFEVYLKVPVS